MSTLKSIWSARASERAKTKSAKANLKDMFICRSVSPFLASCCSAYVRPLVSEPVDTDAKQSIDRDLNVDFVTARSDSFSGNDVIDASVLCRSRSAIFAAVRPARDG